MNICIAFRRIRSGLDITQDELSDLTGLSKSMVSAVENGERDLSEDSIENLRSVLSMSREQLELLCVQNLSDFAVNRQRLVELLQHSILEAIGCQYIARKALGLPNL